MKRILAAALALILALALAGCGKKSEKFTLRDGITWGMSEAEVLANLAKEGDPEVKEEPMATGLKGYMIPNVSVAGTTGELHIVFFGDTLHACGYMLSAEAISADELAAALTEKYGAESEPDWAAIVRAFGVLNGREITEEDFWLDKNMARYWALGDGTVILFYDYGSDINLYYLDIPGIMAAKDESNKSGVTDEGL